MLQASIVMFEHLFKQDYKKRLVIDRSTETQQAIETAAHSKFLNRWDRWDRWALPAFSLV